MTLDALFGSGRIYDLLLALIALEAIGLALVDARRRRSAFVPASPGPSGPSATGSTRTAAVPSAAATLLPNLVAGFALVAAARSTTLSAGWGWTAGWLALSGAAHLVDLHRRRRAY